MIVSAGLKMASAAVMLCLCSCDAPLSGSSASKEGFRYAAPNCDLAVYFPTEPRIRTLSHPQLGSYEEAVLFSGEADDPAMLRTECIPVPNNLERLGGPTAAAGVLQEQLGAHALVAGLDNVQISVEQTALGPTGILEDTKSVGGRPTIYQARSVAGPNSNINLYVSGAASSFPQPGMMAFLNSVELANGGGG